MADFNGKMESNIISSENHQIDTQKEKKGKKIYEWSGKTVRCTANRQPHGGREGVLEQWFSTYGSQPLGEGVK